MAFLTEWDFSHLILMFSIYEGGPLVNPNVLVILQSKVLYKPSGSTDTKPGNTNSNKHRLMCIQSDSNVQWMIQFLIIYVSSRTTGVCCSITCDPQVPELIWEIHKVAEIGWNLCIYVHVYISWKRWYCFQELLKGVLNPQKRLRITVLNQEISGLSLTCVL